MVMSDETPRSRDGRAAVDKAISVLKAFGKDAHLGIGVTELARRSNLSKSTTFRLLGMLERNGVVERAGSAYRLGRVISELGAQSSAPDQEFIRDMVTPFLADLYEATHMTVQVGVLSGSSVIYLNKLEGHQRLRTPSRIGGRMPAYCTAVGKVLLAFDPDATEQALASPRHAWTPQTIVDEDALRSELRRVQEAGIAIDAGESLGTLSCLAAPIMGRDGRPIAAMSISGDATTFRASSYEHVLRRVCYSASRAIAAHRSLSVVA
jgi:IclR family transcriptional regulator, KDG regulon repressor